MELFLQHGEAGTPMKTESVPQKTTDTPNFGSITGYGPKQPTQFMVFWLGRWRRVYCKIWSNVGSLYIIRKGVQIRVTDYE